MASDLYKQIVLDHNRAPRNFGVLPGHTHAADGSNPLCGDALRIELTQNDGRIADLRFSGESCAITTAAASMLSELAGGADADAIAALRARFDALLGGTADAEDPQLRDLNALVELRRYPARLKCALLPFETLSAALRGAPTATTETAPP